MPPARQRLPPSLAAVCLFVCAASAQSPGSARQPSAPPQAGPVEILPLDAVEKGMEAVAWTVFEGAEAEPVPVEILGKLKNAWGPKQDIILAKLGGRALRTNVAAGMSGSPVYHDGKLLGAVALRFSTFSPDAVAGITPIELMLEIDAHDRSLPSPSALHFPAAPRSGGSGYAAADLARQVWGARGARLPDDGYAAAIETPLAFSGVAKPALDLFAGYFRRSGIVAVQGGAVGGSDASANSSAGAMHPGESIAAVLMSGDMSAVGLGTVSYNDGKRVLGFGHAMFNTGPVEMPMAAADVLLVLASQFAPAKISNAVHIVGALRQDRHSGIMGVLGERARMIPVEIAVRNFSAAGKVSGRKNYAVSIFRNRQWTPQLLMLAIYNSIFNVNEVAWETTYRLDAAVLFEGAPALELRMLQAANPGPAPPPLQLAAALAQKIGRVLDNPLDMPEIDSIRVDIDLLPGRRTAAVEHVWIDRFAAKPGDAVDGKVFLRPYRGSRVAREFSLRIPPGAAKGQLTVTAGGAASFNRVLQIAAARNGPMTLGDTVALLNRERDADAVYITLSRQGPTAHVDGRSMPDIPVSLLNVMRSGVGRRLSIETQTPLAEASIPFDAIVEGTQTLTLEVQ